ncbi:hypothetical protein JZY91_03460 [Corynebacterium sp. CNCTC7651]|uniref:hypothetical protein n=1 Tax=Corynebacterium sp. CNCTC7651 TaxID=2815361 RepID=UPI001F36CD1F|nr:hypothetical protein [Corynebacterium sp. CNCTC7651]UIZ92830.1 hypothetical protein JZY91_03460 [Corynebacterium sp. CNCTC7651]
MRLFKYTQTTTGQNAITTKSNPVQELHVELEFNVVSAQRNLSAKDAASFITPTALLMVQTVEASPVWPMLVARTAASRSKALRDHYRGV